MTERISLLIKAKNLSAAQFADEIGVQRSSISHLMSGRNKPSLDLIQKTLQRFPEVSTEWLLFGKGEMVRELNLFDSPARPGRFEPNEKMNIETPTLNREREPSLFTPEFLGIQQNRSVLGGNNEDVDMNHERLTPSVPHLAEEAKKSEVRNDSGAETNVLINKRDNKNESAIDQIIILYENRTFITYSPGI